MLGACNVSIQRVEGAGSEAQGEASEMAQRVKELVTNLSDGEPDDLTLIPRNPHGRREQRPESYPLTFTCGGTLTLGQAMACLGESFPLVNSRWSKAELCPK